MADSNTNLKNTNSKDKPHCTYGFNCGIINASHRVKYYHVNPMPYCKFGVNCNNHAIEHRIKYYHYHNTPEVHELLMEKLNGTVCDSKKNAANNSSIKATGSIKAIGSIKTIGSISSIIKSSANNTELTPKSDFLRRKTDSAEETKFTQFQQNI